MNDNISDKETTKDSIKHIINQLSHYDYIFYQLTQMVSVRKISRETGIPLGRLYKRKNRIYEFIKQKQNE